MSDYTYPPKPVLQFLPLREQPAYRATHRAEGCNLTELLAAVVGGPRQVEIGRALLARFGNLRKILQATPEELQEIPHLGPARVSRLKAALELSKRASHPEDRDQIRNPNDIAQILKSRTIGLEQEHFYVVHLDTRHRILEIELVYKGTLNAAHIRPADIFRGAVRRNAAAIIVAHNHPSGDPSPSSEDLAVTGDLVECGKTLHVQVLDHIVLGSNGRYVSIHDRYPGDWPDN